MSGYASVCAPTPPPSRRRRSRRSWPSWPSWPARADRERDGGGRGYPGRWPPAHGACGESEIEMAMARFPRGINNARQPGAQTWLNLVWACNDVEPGFFGAARHTGPWWAGGDVEEYRHARIITDGDSVRIVGTSGHGDNVIAEAAETLGVTVQPEDSDLLVDDSGDDWDEDEDEDDCEGHESLDGAHMGET